MSSRCFSLTEFLLVVAVGTPVDVSTCGFLSVLPSERGLFLLRLAFVRVASYLAVLFGNHWLQFGQKLVGFSRNFLGQKWIVRKNIQGKS